MWFCNDITKCFASDCPIKEQCHRFTVPPDKYQSYSDFSKLIEDGKCNYYWPVEDEE